MVAARKDKPTGSVRIIGGQWRSRRLPVIDAPGLRPSGDRVRETLFNWVQAFVPGAVCLDLFAGSGVLGFEAASRGAARVTFVEKNAQAVAQLHASAELLAADQLEVVRGDALDFLETQAKGQFDIVFVDPPFQDQLAEKTLARIGKSACLNTDGFVYLETSRLQSEVSAPAGLTCWKDKLVGEVRMQVFRG